MYLSILISVHPGVKRCCLHVLSKHDSFSSGNKNTMPSPVARPNRKRRRYVESQIMETIW